MTTATVIAQKRNGHIYVRAPFLLKETCKSIPGGRWDPTIRFSHEDPKPGAWKYPATHAAALAIKKSFDRYTLRMDEAVAELLVQAHVAEKSLVLKTHTDLPPIPGDTAEMSSWTHQRQAFHWAKDQTAAMLAMDMGTGKSKTTIALLEEWGAQSVLIVCPRNVLNVWPKQFRLHGVREWKIIVPPKTATVQKRGAFIAREVALAKARSQPFAVCVNYEACWRPPMQMALFEHQPWDVVVADESHRIKKPDGKAAKMLATMHLMSKRRLALTGTPMPHSPLDVFSQSRFLDPGVFGTSWTRFKNRYAILGGYEGKQVVDYQNGAELEQLFGNLSFICKAEDVLDLPEYHHVTRTFELTPKTRKAYDQMERDFILWMSEEGDAVTATNALTKLLRLQQMTSGYLNDDNRKEWPVGTEKYELLCDVMDDIPESEPVVVFCKFQYDLERVRDMAIAQGRRFGELSGRVKPGHPDWGLTDDATMREDIDVIAVQIQAGGVGIDLTRASKAVYYSVGFSLGDFEQSLKRIHRPGQDRTTTYIHLVAEKSIDEKVYAALVNRKNIVDTCLSAAKAVGHLHD